jgi:putative membrane protein
MAVLDGAWRVFCSPKYPLWLLAALVGWFACWSWKPKHPEDFALEHILTVLFVGLMLWTYRRFRLSNLSYTLIFLFLALHITGAYYTYSEVPYNRWSATVASWFGVEGFTLNGAMGWTRNHYDRLVHFAFGLLLAYPAREIFLRIAEVRGFWGYYLPLDVMMSLSMVYELLEWAIAVIVAGDVGQSYLGTQGDEWDAHKDMFLASIGALLAMAAVAAVNARWQRDFAREFNHSLRVKDPTPLGEVRLEQQVREARR